MDYRREIDGLRALAVLPVILFHAGFETFSGGFVGVDVFFVISGYLITTIILAELEQGKFSIVNFYERRARRILPALFLVMLVCIPFAWFWLLPSDMKDFSQSLVAVSVFASNILFWRESGYFDTAAELKPLLHTWSLAVEEQYYVLFPLFLMLFWKLGKRWILLMLGLVFVASLVGAQWGAYAKPAAAFYLLPTRGWELLIGAFAAFYLSQANRKEFGKGLSEAAGWLGVALILYAVFAYSKTTPFPGFYALVPTIGTLLIILFATERTTVGSFVGNKAFVGIGLVSYSAYLWHQPLFAFARHQSSTEPSKLLLGLLSAIAILLAYLSWKFVEGPFRKRGLMSRSKVFLLSFLITVVMLVSGIIGHLNNGFPGRLPSNLIWESLSAKLAANGDVCDLKPLVDYDGINACKFGAVGSSKSVILYGDSHAQAINEYLDKEFTRHNIEGIKVGLEGCHIVPSIVEAKGFVSKEDECSSRFESLKAYIESKKADVIVTSRWSFRLYPIKGVIDQMPYQNSEGGREFESYREYAVIRDGKLDFSSRTKSEAVEELIKGFLATNQRIFLIYPVPEIAWNIAKKNWTYYKQQNAILSEISIPYEDYKSRNKFVDEIFDSFSTRENFYTVKPSEIFCDTFIKNRCVAQYDSVPYYYDDDHLSDAGAKLVVDKFLRKIVDE